MRPVAERRILRTLAAAQPFLFGLGHGEFHRRKWRDFVRAVAERLLFRLAAGAPPVVTGGEFQGIGGFLRADWIGHGGLRVL